jgi:nicotinate-nucleotide adenylyltransferase
LGHLILAAEATHQLGIDRLLWVLTPCPPHKIGKAMTPVEDRLAMVQAMIAADQAFKLSRVDIDRPEPHYASETVALLRNTYPDGTMVYLIGGDSLRDLPFWHRPEELIQACDVLGVMRRPGHYADLPTLEESLPGLTEKIRFVDAPLLEISARGLRQRIAAGLPFRYYLHNKVYRIINDRSLYHNV